MSQRRTYLQWLASSAILPWLPAALAQGKTTQSSAAWPRKPVQMVVPFPAGGPSAILSKHLVQAFEQTTGQPMRLSYQSGVGGLAAANLVSKSAADGHTLFMGGSHLTTARVLFPEAQEFDYMEDLRPLALVAQIPQVLVVNPARMRVRNISEWLSELSRKPARYRMATAGIGSSSHIYAELLKQNERLNFDFVHFRGSGPALQDLLNGTTDMMIDGLISCLPHIRSGRLRAMVLTGRVRSPVVPDVPYAQEAGVDMVDSMTWYGLFAPSQLPDWTAKNIERVLEQLSRNPALKATFDELGISWGQLYGDAFAEMVKQETLQWAQTLKAMGLSNLLVKTAEQG